MTIRGFLIWSTLWLTACFNSSTCSAVDLDRPQVTWAGFSLAGSAADIPRLYPYSYKLQDRIQQRLTQLVSEMEPEHYQFIQRQKGDLRLGQSLSITLALDEEKIVIRKLSGVYQAVVQVSANILVFDFDSEEQSIIASYPIRLDDFNEVFTSRPDTAQLSRLVEGYWFGTLDAADRSNTVNLIAAVATQMRSIPLKQKYAAECGIGTVTISDAVTPLMAEFFGHDSENAKRYLARQMAMALYEQRQLSMIPYSVDGRVAQMALQFNGRALNELLTLPEPEYYVDIELQKMKSRKLAEDDNQVAINFGVRFNYTFKDAFGDTLLELSAFDTVRKDLHRSQLQANEWALYRQAIRVLNEKLIEQLEKPDNYWLKRQKFDSKKVKTLKKQFKQLAKDVDQCR